MATVGQALTAPEDGWRRYDDTDSRIQYIGNDWKKSTGDSAFYKGTVINNSILGGSLVLKFYGTKLRIIMQNYTPRSNNLKISIDDDIVEYYSISQYGWQAYQCLSYEKLNLMPGIHTVIIRNEATNNGAFSFDAIDIDSDGYLLHPISVNLTASAGNSQVTLTWDVISGATGYNVKRSTTVGGPYETIASNESGTSYVDTDVVNSTTYYYVVTANTADGESANSNEASATPTAPPVEEGEAVLRVTMIDSSEREYQLTTTVINSFISWINNHTSGNPASYMLNKNVGLCNSKEYLLFDKIISFEVTEFK